MKGQLLISCHDNKVFIFTELGNIIVVIVTNPKFVLPWVQEKFTVKFTMPNVDGYTLYMHLSMCVNDTLMVACASLLFR